MGLIRRADAGQMVRDAVVLDLGDIARQGDWARAQARIEAERIVADARSERERIIAGAAERGHAEGLKRGLEEGRAQGREQGTGAALAETRERLKKLDESWTRALAAFEGARDDMLQKARAEVVALAVRLAERVIRREVAGDAGAAARQVEGVLELLARPTRLVLRVHPDDEALVREALPAMMRRFPGNHAEVTPDATLERGSCVAQSAGGGVIDASIATQVERIAEALTPGRPAPGGAALSAQSSGGPATPDAAEASL